MEGHVKGIMCSCMSLVFCLAAPYSRTSIRLSHGSTDNAVNGVPMCTNALYLNETLRNSWGFDGYVTSDVRSCAGGGTLFIVLLITTTQIPSVMPSETFILPNRKVWQTDFSNLPLNPNCLLLRTRARVCLCY